MYNKINLPGFSAENFSFSKEQYLLFQTSNYNENKHIELQAMRLPGHLGGLGNIRGVYGFWCGAGCGIAFAACLAGCTAAGPFAAACAAACTGLYTACKDSC